MLKSSGALKHLDSPKDTSWYLPDSFTLCCFVLVHLWSPGLLPAMLPDECVRAVFFLFKGWCPW